MSPIVEQGTFLYTPPAAWPPTVLGISPAICISLQHFLLRCQAGGRAPWPLPDGRRAAVSRVGVRHAPGPRVLGAEVRGPAAAGGGAGRTADRRPVGKRPPPRGARGQPGH